MYSKEKLQEILALGLTTGADFSELFFESTNSNNIEMTNGEVSKANTSNVHGVGVRLLKNTEEVYGYTNSTDEKSVVNLIKKLAASFDGEQTTFVKPLKEVEYENITPVVKSPESVKIEDKIKLLYAGFTGAKNTSEEITQVICMAVDKCQNVVIANSEGVYAKDTRTNCRIAITSIASNGKDMQVGSDNVGGNVGYEYYDNIDFVKLGQETAKSALTMLTADECKGGKMTVVVHNGFGGVLLHEACVHSLEATSVARGVSVFCNKLNQKIASDIVTAVDDGTLKNYWGSINVDDEGHPSQRNVLIKDGILQTYLVDYANARKMKHPTTGSGRRQSYKYSPTSRMTNTFFENGKSTFEEIIANTKYGLFAKSMGGGSVNPSTGEFNFSVSEGYLIEDGKITKPVKGATLVGSGAEILMNIDMIANNLTTGHGMCGSRSGSIPTDVGQPTIRVQNITVGGRG